MELEKLLIDAKYNTYKCYDLLKDLLNTNNEFKSKIEEGFLSGKITGFDEEIWEKIRKQNIRRINSFEDVFIEGANIGYCTVASKQLSYSYDYCFLCGGTVDILKGTPNSSDGSHTWILNNGYIIDTTMMLLIEQEYSKKLGYNEQNRYNPSIDPIYMAAKDFTLDENFKKRQAN